MGFNVDYRIDYVMVQVNRMGKAPQMDGNML